MGDILPSSRHPFPYPATTPNYQAKADQAKEKRRQDRRVENLRREQEVRVCEERGYELSWKGAFTGYLRYPKPNTGTSLHMELY